MTEQPIQSSPPSGDDPSDDSDVSLKIAGPFRRNAGLLIGVVIVMLIGPFVSRVLSSYRAVVLELRDESMFIGWERKPPKWVDAIAAQPGQIVVKERGAWGPVVVDPQDYDHELVALFKRYDRSYKGIITRIDKPKTPTGASTAVIELDGGGRVHLALWAEHLAGAAVGRRVEKRARSWDPELVDDEPPPAALAAPPEEAPEPSGEKGAD